MTTKIKKAQFATYYNSKVGDVLEFLEIPYFQDDLRMYYVKRTITKIELTKTGKRIVVTYDKGANNENIGLNTSFQPLTEKFLNEKIKTRGWKK